MKVLTLVILYLVAFKSFSQPDVDKKCKTIYSNYLEKDSLLKVSQKNNDSLVIANKDLKSELSKLKMQLDAIERESQLIKIGNQKWDTDNLKITEMNDGAPIYLAKTRAEWDSLFKIEEPAYCYHKNDSLGNYGYLYNYFAVASGKLAPQGMRLPLKKDVEEMIQFLDSENAKGAMLLKSKDTLSNLPRWKAIGSDKFGMNIKPYGFRLDDSKEWYFANKVYYWCQSMEPKKIEMMVITEINDDPFLLEKTVEDKNSNYGLYVRCIKQ